MSDDTQGVRAVIGCSPTDAAGRQVAEEPVGLPCYSCRNGTIQYAEQRPEGGWVYDIHHGWRCPTCAEAIIEALRAEVLALSRREVADGELRKALMRLRWVVPGRHYGNQIIADVAVVLAHFGMRNAHESRTA